jgi:glycerol kinase
VVYARTDSSDGALHCHEGTVNGAHAALDWLDKRIGIDVRRCLTSLSGALADGRMPLLFLNGIGGLASPYWSPAFASEFVALDDASPGTADATELQQVGAVVESIAFLVAVNVEAMQRTAPLQRLVITGGLAACDYLCEALADATDLAVERPALLEATARGIAWLAGDESQEWHPVPVERHFAPRPQSGLRERFQLWRATLERRLAQ